MGLKKYFFFLWKIAAEELINNIFKLLEENSKAIFLDCGCDEGDFTIEIANRIKAKKIFGIDIIKERYIKAEEKGIIVKSSNLNDPFPFENESIDVLHANQVIEHLYSTDNFISEIYRTLRKGGYAIISTENLASWHNIFALFLGWQPFSSSNISSLRKAVGNPLGLLRKKENNTFSGGITKSMQHMRIFTPKSLKEIFEIHGFKCERLVGAGYHPLSGILARFMARFDVRHTAFLVMKIRKPILQ